MAISFYPVSGKPVSARQILTPTSAGVGGIADVTFTNSGAFVAAGIEGNAAFTLVNAGNVQDVLSGAATFSFANTGASGGLAGDAPISFTHTGLLDLAGVDGAAAVAFTNTGTVGASAGDTTFNFTNTGSIGLLTGTATVTFTHTGAVGAAAGLTTFNFGNTGQIGLLGGAADVTFSHTGDLAGLAGNAPFTFANSGEFTQPSISGAATVTFSHTGFVGLNELLGGTFITFGNTGEITQELSSGGSLEQMRANIRRDLAARDKAQAKRAAVNNEAPATVEKGNLIPQGFDISGKAVIQLRSPASSSEGKKRGEAKAGTAFAPLSPALALANILPISEPDGDDTVFRLLLLAA